MFQTSPPPTGVGENELVTFLEEIEIFVASFVLSFVDKVCDKDSMEG
jgi:hypothetical protein